MLYRAKQDGPVVLVNVIVFQITNYISTYYYVSESLIVFSHFFFLVDDICLSIYFPFLDVLFL